MLGMFSNETLRRMQMDLINYKPKFVRLRPVGKQPYKFG
jgi:hypothetical protein